jgi:spore coat polysaccharide biosynthesis predicted glycosyltransferase SpsG
MQTAFALRDGESTAFVRQEGRRLVPWSGLAQNLPPSAVVVIDSYAADTAFFGAARQRCDVLTVIDDFADRRIDADLVINQNLFATAFDYGNTPALIGIGYALIDQRLRSLRESRSVAHRFLVTFGGTDDGRFAAAATNAIKAVRPDAEIDVVLSPLCEVSAAVATIQQAYGDTVLIHHGADIPTLMAHARLYVGGAGSATYEAGAAGVPVVALVMAENHRRNGQALREIGVPVVDWPNIAGLRKAIARALDQPGPGPLSGRVDGCGAERVAAKIRELVAAARRPV